MTRRGLVVLVSAGVLLTLAALAVGTVGVLTRTDWGRNKIRAFVVDRLASSVHGKLYVGHIGGSFLTGLTIDSLEIRDAEDTVFLSTGPISVAYDPRDLIDKRVLLRHVDVEHPTVYLWQHENWGWNFRRLFRSAPQRTPQAPGRSFGDFVALDSVHLRDASLVLTLPWHPDDSLHGARRDSAIASELTRKDKELRRSREGLTRTWRWTGAYAALPHLHLVDPDTAGWFFAIDTVNVDERDPPFAFRNVQGTLHNLGDSIWFDVTHFDLPGSTGRGTGKIWWGHDLPTRYALRIQGDSVTLADVAWVYPTLPPKGSGSMVLDIRNETDLRMLDYVLTNMDVRTTGSRLRGQMTFGVGDPVLIVKDVKLEADPVDFDLLRTLNGKPFPVDWQGKLKGTVVARGGPLTNFVVDDASLSFDDAHVPGAQSIVSGRGELDILFPAFTAFHGFDVAARTVDLRSIEYLYPNFPRLHGTLSGAARLDSIWTDVRFAGADLVYVDGDAPRSRLTGSGRVTYGDQFMTYDVTLRADSLSLTGLRRSYPTMPLKGLMAGTIRAQGTTDDLQLRALLEGPAGALSFDGRIDVFEPSYGVRGSGHFAAFNPSLLVDSVSVPSASLHGDYTVDARWESLATLVGSAGLSLEASELDSIHVFSAQSRVRFADAKMHVDTLRMEATAATLNAVGAVGLRPDVNDSIRFAVTVDSLGGLRRYLRTNAARLAGKPDSLAGSLAFSGAVSGNFDSLEVRGKLAGSEIYMNGDRGTTIRGTVALRDVLHEPQGSVTLGLISLSLAGVAIDTIGAVVELNGPKRGSFTIGATASAGTTTTLTARGRVSGGSGSAGASIDTLALKIDDDVWALAAPAAIRRDSAGTMTIDSVALRNGHGGSIALSAFLPASDTVALAFRADSLPIADIGKLLQVSTPMSGWADVHVGVRGTQALPRIGADAVTHTAQFGSMKIDRATGRADYADRRMEAAVTLFRGGAAQLAANATLPMELTLFSGRELPDTLHGTIRGDSADFAIIEAVAPTMFSDAKGNVAVALALGGTWDHMTLDGRVRMDGAEVLAKDAGITLKGITADLRMFGAADSISLDTLRAWSGKSAANSISAHGFLRIRDRQNPFINFQLDAHNFHAFDRKALGRVDISTGPGGLSLTGPEEQATLSGSVTVERGVIFMPDQAQAKKQLVSLSLDDLDSTDMRLRATLPSPPSKLVENLALGGVSITLGEDVALQSAEADIKLVGSLNVKRARETRARGRSANLLRGSSDTTIYRLALDGTLTAVRGRYTVELGPWQRDFQVEGGTIRFYGTTDLNPNIDISALYNVRQYNRPDIKVRVRLSGYLYPQPTLSLESAESFDISQSDLFSYLCCGVPNFELGTNQGAVRAAAQVFLPTASSVLTRGLRRGLGSWVDLLQFQAGATDNTGAANNTNAYRDFFAGARFGGEKQITNNLFFSFSAGLCQFEQTQTGDPGANSFAEQLAGKFQYRFTPTLSAELGREPPASALNCGRGFRGFVPTPQQWGLALSKSWFFR